VNKFILKKIKKCETKFSSKLFQTLIFFKKKRWKKEKKRKKNEDPNLLFVITLIFMSPTTQIFYTLCS